MRLCAELDDFKGFESLTDEITRFSSFGIRPGLKRISRLLYLLGNPEKGLASIQILGTNGKGSSAAAMEAILLAAGFKTALYTSPHLISLQERLRLSGGYAALPEWQSQWRKIIETVERDELLLNDKPSFFEHFTALSILVMKEEDIDIAILEAGMGGRYDTTTACDAKAVMINPIGMDHMQYLGGTLEEIASEKFAAVREGADAFYSGDDARLTGLFLEYCGRAGVEPHLLDRMALPIDIKCDIKGTVFSYKVMEPEINGEEDMKDLETPLPGRHQAFNAARAVTVLRCLKKRFPAFSAVTPEAIRSGLRNTRWPGRMEILKTSTGKAVMLDGAHNEHGAKALVSSLQNLENDGKKVKTGALVFAVMADKDFVPLLRELKKLDSPLYCTRLPMERSLDASALANHAQEAGLHVAGVFDEPSQALEAAAQATGEGELTVCCGSLFLVGHLKKELDMKKYQ